MIDFYNNLTSLTSNLEDIAFKKYGTITNINQDGTCTAKEDEEDGLTHENVSTLSHNLKIGDKVVIGFVDNSIYNPIILGSLKKDGSEDADYTIDFDLNFTGVSGRDDSMTFSIDLVRID